MPMNIPLAGFGSPDWLSTAATHSDDLNDVRWYGAMKTTFGAGAAGNNSFRAIQAVDGGQRYLYLSFRAGFVQSLSDQYDTVYLGLQRTGSTKAMVIQMQVHSAANTPSGPPSASVPADIQLVQFYTRLATDPAASPEWTGPVVPSATSWLANKAHACARAWLHPADAPLPPNTPPPPNYDPNNRWAIELRIPVMSAGDIAADGGPNIDLDFNMWYVIQGTVGSPPLTSPVILADYRTGTTAQSDLENGRFPIPFGAAGVWNQFLLTSAPGTFGGVAINGNGSNDIRVLNPDTGIEGILIAKGKTNKFIVRPRNYRPVLGNDPVTGQDKNAILAGNINATIRITNYGSTASDQNWAYIPGNSAAIPVNSSTPIPPLSISNPPPTSTTPITLDALMNLSTNATLHHCVLVTLSGTNLNFLNDSAYQNMDFDKASLLEREAEISVVGLTPVSPQPRDVYLAIEKINMLRNTPAGTNEGRFLEGSMQRLIEQGGELGEKLKSAQSILSDAGDYGSGERLDSLLNSLRQVLAEMKYNDPEQGKVAPDQLIATLSRWLLAEKQNEDAAKRLAALFDALAGWLLATGPDAAGKLDVLMAQLNQWLSGLSNDPASLELVPAVTQALRGWLSALADGGRLAGAIEGFEGWLRSGRPAEQLPAILDALREFLASLSSDNDNLRGALGMFSEAVARWLKGYERLDTFVSVLSDAGLTEDETDTLFPTFRVHTYHDTGERVTGSDGNLHPVLRVQSSFGLYAYHEGGLDGWQTSIQGAQRIADNLYLLAVPNNGTARVNVRIQAVEPGAERIPEDPIKPIGPIGPTPQPGGCLNILGTILKSLADLVRALLRGK